LKRFSVKGPFTDKIETVVDFPLRGLDLTNYMPPPLPPDMLKGCDNPSRANMNSDPRVQVPPYKYDLYGVTNHFGNLSNGHCELVILWFVTFSLTIFQIRRLLHLVADGSIAMTVALSLQTPGRWWYVPSPTLFAHSHHPTGPPCIRVVLQEDQDIDLPCHAHYISL
jgi:hypothetical protein